MILSNEFTVGAEIETVWRHLLDMEGVARCLPGATIEAADEENTYNGSIRVRMGPMTVEYKGTAKLAEADEENHTAKISLSARTKKGQGTAMATIQNRLEPDDRGTRVIAETDLHITGPQAQFGRGVMEDVGGRVLGEFSRRLEQRIAGEDERTADGTETAAAPSEAGGSRATSPPAPAEEDHALDLGAHLSRSTVGRCAKVAAVVVAAVVIARIVLRRR